MQQHSLSRRRFLKAAGVCLALPVFESAFPTAQAAAAAASARRRFIGIDVSLSFHGPFFFPKEAGRDYTLSPYLEPLAALRDRFTVFSGVSHPEVDGGHSADMSFLTAAPHPGLPTFRNTISLDQLAAEKFRGRTRFDSLALSSAGASISFTGNGVRVPGYDKPSVLFAQLFLKGSEKEIKQQAERLTKGKSILDAVQDQARELEKGFGAGDRQKLDEYLTAVRECEKSLAHAKSWLSTPKPTVKMAPPQDITNGDDVVGRCGLMFDLMHLALQTDSTRFITFYVHDGAGGVPPNLPGVEAGYHGLSHHGLDPKRIAQLRIIELALMKTIGGFLTKLNGTKEESGTLLDQTTVLLGSGMGSAASHDNHNLPVLLAGGGFRHGQHLAFDTRRNAPLCNVFVSVLQWLGLEVDKFGSSTGTMKGLELS
jgi:hypothetical protein